jgi:hypothetical protein
MQLFMRCLPVCLNRAGQAVETATPEPLANNSFSLLVPLRPATPHIRIQILFVARDIVANFEM